MMKYYAIAVALFFSCQLNAEPAVENLSGLTYETEHYKIIYDTDTEDIMEIANLLEFAYTHFNNIFAANGFNLRTPTEKMVWYCFANQRTFSVHALEADGMDLYWLTGYYSARTNSVCIVKPGNVRQWKKNYDYGSQQQLAQAHILPSMDNAGNELTMILHEAAHQLAFNTGLQNQKVMYPIWFSEGLAVNFENSVPNSVAGVRLQRLCRMHNQNTLLAIKDLIVLTRMPADALRRKDIYAQSSIFFKFLAEYYPENLRSYISALYNRKSGWRSSAALYTEFITAFGPISKIDCNWQNYLANLEN